MTDFFETESEHRPLADRLRPIKLEQVWGQSHLLAEGKPLRMAIEANKLHSMVFWGPPGTGKTTLARLIAHYSDAHFITLSAVLSGVKDIRDAVQQAKQISARTVLFVDEVHRFNKSQQDAFLPHIEDGTLLFIGATTENPSFELNNALLSRVRTYVLKSVTADDMFKVIDRALKDDEMGLGKLDLSMDKEAQEVLVASADGDVRKALTYLEIASDLTTDHIIDARLVKEVAGQGVRRFDNKGDIFYDQISALHKSVRGSDPDAALYWFSRMLDGGCDPAYIARRVVRMAIEDIGLADPRGLDITLNGWKTYERLGSPEGDLAIAQGIVYIACAAKSNAVYQAYNESRAAAERTGSLEVPKHLRNAPTQLMKSEGYGENYRYAHDEEAGFAAGERYFPDEMPEAHYYKPVNRGLEQKIGEKLNQLKLRNRDARNE
ncbi:MAG: putative ATPase [Gammaproteobacteria bacterium]